MRFMLPSFSRGATAALVVALACTSAAAQSLFSQYGEVVIAAGDNVPGLPGLTIQLTTNVDSPVLDQNGTMLFRARMAGAVALTNDRVYLLGRTANDLRVVLRSGDQAPGLAAGILMQTATGTGPTGTPCISPFGEILFFSSSLNDGGATVTTANDTALFWGPPGSYVVLAREGDPVNIAGVAGAYTFGSQTVSGQFNTINANGVVLFSTALIGAPADQDSVMVTGAPNALTKVMQEGDVFPDGSIVVPTFGTTLSGINQLNEAGQVLHEVKFSTTVGAATTANDRALAIWTPGFGDTVIAREGQQAPGLAPGILFATPSSGWSVDTGAAVFTKSGNCAISAALDQGGVTAIDDRAIYYGGVGGMNLVVRKNDPTGQPNDVRFGVFNTSSLTSNDAGQIAVVSSLQNGTVPGIITATNDTCIAFGSAGNVTPIAVEGSPVPGIASFVFGSIAGGTNSPHLNALGHVVFQVTITDGVTPRPVIFCHDALHGTRVLLDGNDTITTTVGTANWFTGGSVQFNSADGGPSHFNNSGDWAAKINFNSPLTGAILRGRTGSLQATPASLDTVAGGTQTFAIDATPAHGNSLYVILGTQSGTRPGFLSPLGPQNVPLNNDAWTQLSLSLANSAVYPNSLWFTDAQGKNLAPTSFTLPPNVPGLQGLMLHHAVIVLDFNLVSTYVSEPAALRLY